VKCAFCGFQFEKGDALTSCKGCPMAGACHKLRCPNCGYENALGPDLSGIRKAWKRLFARKTKARVDGTTL
jgi:hypothetical protein